MRAFFAMRPGHIDPPAAPGNCAAMGDLSRKYDVLVAGGGNAALCAAIAARAGRRERARLRDGVEVLSRRQYAPHAQYPLRA